MVERLRALFMRVQFLDEEGARVVLKAVVFLFYGRDDAAISDFYYVTSGKSSFSAPITG